VLKCIGPYDAIFGNSHEALRDFNALFTSAPEPVDQDLGHGLITNFINPPTIPECYPQNIQYIFFRKQLEIIDINIPIPIFIETHLAPGEVYRWKLKSLLGRLRDISFLKDIVPHLGIHYDIGGNHILFDPDDWFGFPAVLQFGDLLNIRFAAAVAMDQCPDVATIGGNVRFYNLQLFDLIMPHIEKR
jgi:hypothetical protein